LLRDNGHLDLALFDVKDRIGRVTLCIDDFLLPMSGNGARPFADAPKYSAGSNFEPFFLLAILGFGITVPPGWAEQAPCGITVHILQAR
jgi:hypothetical protein